MTVELTPVTVLGATYHFQDPFFILGLMFPFKQWTLSTLLPTQSSTQIHTYTPPLKICCIFVSSSGTISWCQACVVWSDSHALCRGVEGWMDAQSTIALINTNSYARCSQVSISSQCSFSFGCRTLLTAWRFSDSIFHFCLAEGKRNIVLLRQHERDTETEGPSATWGHLLELYFMCFLGLYSKLSQCAA